MTNPLLQKYDEIRGKKEEPKPTPIPSYHKNYKAIATLESLLKDLKSGRASMTDCKIEGNYKHYDMDMDMNTYVRGLHPLSEPMHIMIDNGEKITLEIFRKYD